MEYLLTMNSSLPIILGRMFKQPPFNVTRFMTGGPGAFYLFQFQLTPEDDTLYSGYLFTRESLRRVVEIGFNQNLCSTFNLSGQSDDMILGNFIDITSYTVNTNKLIYSGRCLDILNVTFVDDRDQDGRHRFMHYTVENLFNGGSFAIHSTNMHDHYPHGPVCWMKIIFPLFITIFFPKIIGIELLLHSSRKFPLHLRLQGPRARILFVSSENS